eukprot:TRINITY_DN7142_c0_g1_i1.p2 TRINITY_DN7142_c0_g1~~TRINITY_DN7142_c0_g1_i1.p2  ORF type:complete len:128 (+),score=31.69 TRINITY_DN7142_c0_g1_i1:1228-1611(+)
MQSGWRIPTSTDDQRDGHEEDEEKGEGGGQERPAGHRHPAEANVPQQPRHVMALRRNGSGRQEGEGAAVVGEGSGGRLAAARDGAAGGVGAVGIAGADGLNAQPGDVMQQQDKRRLVYDTAQNCLFV